MKKNEPYLQMPVKETFLYGNKKNMFALLNKPGYEEESKAIQARL